MSEVVTLIDRLIAEQQSLTAVERFSQKHASTEFPAQARHYRDLIPLTKPAPGQQYSFEVNLDKCTGCKACVSACHSLNGLEEDETWRDVGVLFSHGVNTSYQQTVTTACHHCADPGCLQGCPVMAYEKEPLTGIVRHLDDQCIGCQYCTMKCPYGVPKYSERLGIVRKCDMCHDRLAAGEAPACVQACPHEAITIKLVDIEEVTMAASPGQSILPGAFDSSYTKPTTRYVSSRPVPADAHGADSGRLHLEHAHWPLIIMLVLTQLAVGQFLAQAVLEFTGAASLSLLGLAGAGFVFLNAGLFAAVFHLGRPVGAWRFFLGLRTSWMSREILAFSLLPGAVVADIALGWFWPGSNLARSIALMTALAGLGAVFTSAMIYIDTRRTFWSAGLTLPRFFGAVLTLGAASIPAALALGGLLSGALDHGTFRLVAGATIILSLAIFIWERNLHRRALSQPSAAAHESARIVEHLLGRVSFARGAFLGASVASWLVVAAFPEMAVIPAIIGLVSALAAQILERYIFFTAVVALRMPGGL